MHYHDPRSVAGATVSRARSGRWSSSSTETLIAPRRLSPCPARRSRRRSPAVSTTATSSNGSSRRRRAFARVSVNAVATVKHSNQDRNRRGAPAQGRGTCCLGRDEAEARVRAGPHGRVCGATQHPLSAPIRYAHQSTLPARRVPRRVQPLVAEGKPDSESWVSMVLTSLGTRPAGLYNTLVEIDPRPTATLSRAQRARHYNLADVVVVISLMHHLLQQHPQTSRRASPC